jgi:hypothetical protein
MRETYLKFSLGFRVTFDRSHSPTKLKVTCRVSKVMASGDSVQQTSSHDQAIV